MTITPEGYKLLMDDPKKFRYNDRNSIAISRPIIEELILFYLFSPEQVNDKFIEDVKAPACKTTTKFLISYVNKLNNHLSYEAAIDEAQLEEYLGLAISEAKFSVEYAKEKLSKYSAYIQFLMMRPGKIVVSGDLISNAVKIANELEIKYGDVLKCGKYEQKTTNRLHDNQIYSLLQNFKTSPEHAIDKDTHLFRQHVIGWYEDNHVLAVPIDIINQTSQKKADIFNIRILDYSIKDIKSKNEFWFELGLQKYILDQYTNYEINQHLLVVDSKGYTILVNILPATSNEYKETFIKAKENIKKVYQLKLFDTYQGFESGTIKL